LFNQPVEGIHQLSPIAFRPAIVDSFRRTHFQNRTQTPLQSLPQLLVCEIDGCSLFIWRCPVSLIKNHNKIMDVLPNCFYQRELFSRQWRISPDHD
jgi:hypothetical protein